jgi:hypothetical protein
VKNVFAASPKIAACVALRLETAEAQGLNLKRRISRNPCKLRSGTPYNVTI